MSERSLLSGMNAAALLVSAAMLTACGGNAPSGPPAPRAPSTSPPGTIPLASQAIKHIVIIVQENRSFDNLFSGFPGADSATSGMESTGTVVPLNPIGLEDGHDLDHSHHGFEVGYNNGAMNGFDLEQYFITDTGPAGTYPYSRIEQSEVQPYWDLASKYTLADHMFSTETSGSFTAHQYLIAGQSDSLVDFPSNLPWGCDSPPGTTVPTLEPSGAVVNLNTFPCLNYETVAQVLDNAGVSWKNYAPQVQLAGHITDNAEIWSAFDAASQVRYGPDWTRNVISPETTVLSDIQNGALAQVSWVIPDFANSDHPEARSNSGPSWVSSVVNAIGQSQYWNSTAILIVWDDWGGWYDNVAPPQLDYLGLGMRVPMIVVSPYARKGYVSHTQYEFGSILKFTEQIFNLDSLGQTDVRANSIVDCFDFTQQPTPFSLVRSPMSTRQILSRPPSLHWVDNE